MNPHGLNPDLVHEVSNLPVPDAVALEHSEQLVNKIRAELDVNDGHIGFNRYMEMVLYEPGLGYYSAGARKFGKDGDFVTAPEISSLFSFCLARQCNQILSDLKDGVILELGAGTGRMACDILLDLKQTDSLPEKYLILETSADLKQRQQHLLNERLPDYFNRIEWLERLPENPINGVILANEVLDALPVHRVVDRDDKLNELHVSWHEDGFTWSEQTPGPDLIKQIQHIKKQLQYKWQGAYTTEINLAMVPWIASLSDTLQQGVILLIDYGYSRREYYHPERTQGTLLCHYRHRVHSDPFLYPGLQDITASVDFTAVAEAAISIGLEVSGYTTQAFFLIACGLDEILDSHLNDDQKNNLELTNQVKSLTLPGDMGERFKVIGLGRGMETSLMGFEMMDHRKHL